MFTYSKEKLESLIQSIIQRSIPETGNLWLIEELRSIQEKNDPTALAVAFVISPRKTGKNRIVLTPEEEETLQTIRPGLSLDGWTADELVRVWWLLHVDASDSEQYVRTIENLFLNAEMNELVALYSSLPVLAYPERWRKRCAEGIRSNIGRVLERVMCGNPYPSEQLDEPAWNQLVLKAIFTDKPLLKIHRLRDRANVALAKAISDFAHERWAANRTVNPIAWVCVEKFVDETLLPDIERLAYSTESLDRKAAALVCAASTYAPAKILLDRNPELKSWVTEDKITWEALAGENSSVV